MKALNIFLLAATLACAWLLHANWEAAQARRSLVTPVVRPRVTPYEAPPAAAPAAPAQYAGIALHNLFSRDRHADVVSEAPAPEPPPPPVPAFPCAYGVVDLGDGPVALLAWEGRQKPYAKGEAVGPWRLQAIAADRLTLEWTAQGRTFEKPLSELIGRAESVRAEPETEAPVNVRPSPPPVSDNPWHCQPGDSSPAGTIVQGRRKMESNTPFGRVCRWEPVV